MAERVPSEWEARATKAAEMFGVTIIVGVRFKGTWFAHADDIEYDGDGPADALDAVLAGLVQRAESQERSGREAAERARRQLADLGEVSPE